MAAAVADEPVVWVVSGQQWPRAYLRAELIERGYDAIGFMTLRDAIVRLMLERSRRPAVLVLDLHGQLLDERLLAVLIRQRIPVIGVVDRTSATTEALRRLTRVLQRPLTIGSIADAVGGVVGRPAAPP